MRRSLGPQCWHYKSRSLSFFFYFLDEIWVYEHKSNWTSSQLYTLLKKHLLSLKMIKQGQHSVSFDWVQQQHKQLLRGSFSYNCEKYSFLSYNIFHGYPWRSKAERYFLCVSFPSRANTLGLCWLMVSKAHNWNGLTLLLCICAMSPASVMTGCLIAGRLGFHTTLDLFAGLYLFKAPLPPYPPAVAHWRTSF